MLQKWSFMVESFLMSCWFTTGPEGSLRMYLTAWKRQKMLKTMLEWIHIVNPRLLKNMWSRIFIKSLRKVRQKTGWILGCERIPYLVNRYLILGDKSDIYSCICCRSFARTSNIGNFESLKKILSGALVCPFSFCYSYV